MDINRVSSPPHSLVGMLTTALLLPIGQIRPLCAQAYLGFGPGLGWALGETPKEFSGLRPAKKKLLLGLSLGEGEGHQPNIFPALVTLIF